MYSLSSLEIYPRMCSAALFPVPCDLCRQSLCRQSVAGGGSWFVLDSMYCRTLTLFIWWPDSEPKKLLDQPKSTRQINSCLDDHDGIFRNQRNFPTVFCTHLKKFSDSFLSALRQYVYQNQSSTTWARPYVLQSCNPLFYHHCAFWTDI